MKTLALLLAFVGCGGVAVVDSDSLTMEVSNDSRGLDSSSLAARDGGVDLTVDSAVAAFDVTSEVQLDPQGVPCSVHCAAWRADGMPQNTWAEYCGKVCG